jgi:predicted phosphodiesterase
MKTLVIPDVHQRTQFVRHILNTETNYDEVVFLGDWFDSFYEPPKVTSFEETCEYLRHLVLDHSNKDKFVFLIGNHDLSYIHENKDFSCSRISKTLKYYCSGFTASKAKKFSSSVL